MFKFDRLLTAARQAMIIAVVTIVLCEIGLRVFKHVYPLPFFYSNSYNRFRVKPHSMLYGFPLNSHGFRDGEYKVEKEPGIFRILGIGDSFAFGIVPYPSNYLTLTEERLNSGNRRFELINMGIPGMNPREYVAILLHEGVELKPDMVLLSFFIGNDFVETTKVSKIYRYSYLANVVKFVYDVNAKMRNLDFGELATYDDKDGPFKSAAYIQLERTLSGIFIKSNEGFESLFANTIEHLSTLKRICDLNGIRLAVVLIPDEMQVDPGLQRQVIEASGLSSENFDFDQPNERLKGELRRLGINYLDLLHPMREATKHTRLYRRNDTHWNIAGNSLAAELIIRYLQPKLPTSARR